MGVKEVPRVLTLFSLSLSLSLSFSDRFCPPELDLKELSGGEAKTGSLDLLSNFYGYNLWLQSKAHSLV